MKAGLEKGVLWMLAVFLKHRREQERCLSIRPKGGEEV